MWLLLRQKQTLEEKPIFIPFGALFAVEYGWRKKHKLQCASSGRWWADLVPVTATTGNAMYCNVMYCCVMSYCMTYSYVMYCSVMHCFVMFCYVMYCCVMYCFVT
jgi:hypothetical protein